MPVFAKFDGVDGESTDHFEFKKDTGASDIVWNDEGTSPDPMALGMLLPAVQSAREPERASGDDDGGMSPPDIIIWDIDGDGEGYYQPALPDMDWLG